MSADQPPSTTKVSILQIITVISTMLGIVNSAVQIYQQKTTLRELLIEISLSGIVFFWVILLGTQIMLVFWNSSTQSSFRQFVSGISIILILGWCLFAISATMAIFGNVPIVFLAEFTLSWSNSVGEGIPRNLVALWGFIAWIIQVVGSIWAYNNRAKL